MAKPRRPRATNHSIKIQNDDPNTLPAPDSVEWLTVKDALQLVTQFTGARMVRTIPYPRTPIDDVKLTSWREQKERALREAYKSNELALLEEYESRTLALWDAESLRVRNPSRHVDATRQRVTAAIRSCPLSEIAGMLWISLDDVNRFAELRGVEIHFCPDDVYNVENEIGFTIQGAARALAKKYAISAGVLKQRIFEATEQGKLQVRDPQTGIAYVPENRSSYYERIRVSDLNQWLEESGVPYRLEDNSEEPLTPTAELPEQETNLDAINPNAYDEDCAALFDPVTVAVLETIFPAGNRWKTWTERAKRNGLIRARTGRGKFNPYWAGLWFLHHPSTASWDRNRVMRRLANNLPGRSKGQEHLLTGDIE